MFGFRVPNGDQIMLISGGKTKDGKPFEIHRGAKFIFPGAPRKVSFISLTQRKAVIQEACMTTQGLEVQLDAVVAFKVDSSDAAIYAAGERFLDDQRRDEAMTNQTRLIFTGHLRSIVGDMTYESILRNRTELSEKVLEASETEVASMGLHIDSFQITDFHGPAGYAEALAAPQRAAVEQAASIAQSQAQQAAAQAQQESVRKQAEYARDTELAKAQNARDTALAKANYDKDASLAQAAANRETSLAVAAADRDRQKAAAEYQTEVDAAQQTAAQAGPLAAAKAAVAVTEQNREVAKQNALLVEAQLQATEIKPAEAAAAKMRIDSEAQANATKVSAQAEAARIAAIADANASNDRVNVDLRLVELLPEIVRGAASGLVGGNLTVFNGAEGVNEILAGALTQGLSILDTVQKRMANAGANTENNKPQPVIDVRI